ncbi:MAG TPA: hypothetical protein PKU93_03410 [Candidatus Pacearchaeota archaeon]|nr:hypothetical protein [Candidatus Pacearchaeota archaeon]
MQVIIDRSIKSMDVEERKKEIRHTMAVCAIILIDPRTSKPWIIEHLSNVNLMIALKMIRELRDQNFKGKFELHLQNERMLGDPNNYRYLEFRECYY